MQPPTFSRIFGLDCLRAIAISLVIISHCTFLVFPNMVNTVLTFIRLMGAVGVDLFFVLSGYLIGGILLKMMTSGGTNWSYFKRFWKRRWFRTLPNYFLILGINILLALVIGAELPKSIALYGLFLQNFSSGHPDFFTEAWSLSVEEYAYLLLPFLLYLGCVLSKTKNRTRLFGLITIATILFLTFLKIYFALYADVTSYKYWSLGFRKVVIYRIDSIYLGFLLIYLITIFPDVFKRYKNLLFAAGLLLFLLLHLMVYIFNILPEGNIWFYTLIYLQVIIVSLALLFPYFIELKADRWINKLIVFVSTRSYAIYLVNYSIVLLHLQMVLNIEDFSFLGKLGLVFIFLGITVLLSNLMFVYFEAPILKYRNRKFPRHIED